MRKEYRTITEVVGPLMMVKDGIVSWTRNTAYDLRIFDQCRGML